MSIALIVVAVIVALVVGVLFARKNPKKADALAQGVAAAGRKIEAEGKQAVDKITS